MASRLPPSALSLKHFLLRQQALQLYRDILRSLRQVPDPEHKKYLVDWARHEFKQNKGETDEEVIRMMLSRGRLQYKELQKTLSLVK
ncbi:LYR motif-containing protein 2-like [Branchiostoma lanceolatum]|uniref:LYR motif-containing protein 2-like n=1 Tax=Branchiostoma lanceolatum TaxID=7740 RepID=UPI00345693A2